jgi:hypothetical protein
MLRRLLVANGVPGVPVFPQPFRPRPIWAAAPRLPVFPLAMLCPARDFGRDIGPAGSKIAS